jgi:translation initiation factor 3 subunit
VEKTDLPVDKLSNKSVVICRICGATGDHFTLRCPFKGREEELPMDAPGRIKWEEEKAVEGDSGGPSVGGKYVPPSRRGGAGGGETLRKAWEVGDKMEDRGTHPPQPCTSQLLTRAHHIYPSRYLNPLPHTPTTALQTM